MMEDNLVTRSLLHLTTLFSSFFILLARFEGYAPPIMGGALSVHLFYVPNTRVVTLLSPVAYLPILSMDM